KHTIATEMPRTTPQMSRARAGNPPEDQGDPVNSALEATPARATTPAAIRALPGTAVNCPAASSVCRMYSRFSRAVCTFMDSVIKAHLPNVALQYREICDKCQVLCNIKFTPGWTGAAPVSPWRALDAGSSGAPRRTRRAAGLAAWAASRVVMRC